MKGKAIPLQAWTGPENSRNLRLPYFKTSVVARLRVESFGTGIPSRAIDLCFLKIVHTAFGVYQDFYSMGIGVLSRG
jgi:hypothetical protein